MTQDTASPATDTDLPELEDIHMEAMTLCGLIEAANELSDAIGHNSRGRGLFAVITSALPLAHYITDNLERLTDSNPAVSPGTATTKGNKH